MLINFVGAPGSGKTTVAAKVFANLKDNGHVAEFVPEEARYHIARLRKIGRLTWNENHPKFIPFNGDLLLTDQQEIAVNQSAREDVFAYDALKIINKTFVISDSSPLNAMLYVNPDERKDVYDFILKVTPTWKPDIIFYCPLFPKEKVYDPNRVHDYKQALEVDGLLPDLVWGYLPDVPLVALEGTSDERAQQVLDRILDDKDHRTNNR